MTKLICNEIIKSVIGYEGYYEISESGEVWGIERMVVSDKGLRTIRGKKMNTRINNDGYVSIALNKNGKTKTTFLHILLAKAFIPNPDNKPEINHINGIKTDNRLENLEWVTHSENMKHAYKMQLMKPPCKHVKDNCSGKEYTSIKEAAICLSIPYSSLKGMLNGQRKNYTCLEITINLN